MTVYLSQAIGAFERSSFNLWEPNSDRTRPRRRWGGPDGARVRTALAMAMNRQAVVDKILHGKATVAVNEMDHTEWFNASLTPYPFDPQQAERLLDDLGWRKGADGIRARGGVPFEFVHGTASGNVTRETIQRAILADLEKIGVRMKIENYTPSETFANHAKGGVAATGRPDVWGWTTGSTDPDMTSLLANANVPTAAKPDGQNDIGLKDAEMDRLLQKQATAIDPKERKAALDNLQAKLHADCPILYIHGRSHIDAARKDVAGIEPSSAAGFWWNVHEWGLTKKR